MCRSTGKIKRDNAQSNTWYISSLNYRYCDTGYLILLPRLLNQWWKCKYLLSATHLDCILPHKSESMFLITTVFYFPIYDDYKGCWESWIFILKELICYFILTFLLLAILAVGLTTVYFQGFSLYQRISLDFFFLSSLWTFSTYSFLTFEIFHWTWNTYQKVHKL